MLGIFGIAIANRSLERAARAIFIPAFQRIPITLNADQQRVVATWAIKTWLLAEIAHAQDRTFSISAPNILNYMWQHREPPPMVIVRLGAVNAERKQVASVHSMWVHAVDQEPPVGALGLLPLADLIFHTYCPVYADGSTPNRLVAGSDMEPYLSQIWPNEVPEVSWPPARILPWNDLVGLMPVGRVETIPT